MMCHSEPFACHPEPLACHPERSEEPVLKNLALPLRVNSARNLALLSGSRGTNQGEIPRFSRNDTPAGVVLRWRVPNTGSMVELSSKFGCEPGEAVHLICAADDLVYSGNIGAYSNASSTWFNGFPPATVVDINQ